MKTYAGVISTDKVGSDVHFSFEVEEDASSAEVEAAAREAAFSHIEMSYEEEPQ